MRNSVKAASVALVALTMLAGSACNASVPPPADALDIGVADLGGGNHVVGALAADGSVAVKSARCTGSACALAPWFSLGGNVTSLQIDATSPGHVVVVGLAPGGATWFRRGACPSTECTWSGWRKLGGKLEYLSGAQSTSSPCVNLAGLTTATNVYRAEICENGTTAWQSAHGAVFELEVSPTGALFGPRFHGHTYVGKPVGAQVAWTDIGGSTGDPATNPTSPSEQCGLSTTSRQLWCHSPSGWSRVGGTWARLDDGSTVGISDDGSVLDWRGTVIEDSGGSMTQVAREGDLQVAISTDGVAQFRNFRDQANAWQNLS
jgi:hypothetical protein